MGYPGTILIVVPSLVNLQTNGTLTEGTINKPVTNNGQFSSGFNIYG